MSKTALAALAIGGIALAAAGYLVLTRSNGQSGADQVEQQADAADDNTGPKTVLLPPDLISGTNIKIGPVGTAPLDRNIPLTALVEANINQQSIVVSPVGGRVTRADVEVGQTVQRGQVLAELASPDLVDAQRAFLAAKSELQAHEASLQRLEKLLGIGAIPRQDVEKARSQQSALALTVEEARARLQLYGLSTEQIAAVTSVASLITTSAIVSPTDGVLTVRLVDVNATVVAGAPAFTVANLATVWAVSEISDTDVGRVHPGNPVVVTPTMPVVMPGAAPPAATPATTTGASTVPAGTPPLRGTISYVDPQLNPETKATKVRADVTNDAQALRPGMSVQMVITADEAPPAVVVPRVAVDRVDDRRIVYVADPQVPHRFVERTIQVGREMGELLQVVSGLADGDTIVVDGVGLVSAQAAR